MPNLADLPHFQYKLNENTRSYFKLKKVPGCMQVEGINISEQWTTFPYKQRKLDRYIKNNSNPNGPLDMQVVIPSKGTVVEKEGESVKNIDVVPEFFYSKEELEEMERPELKKVATDLGLEYKYKKDRLLIESIMKQQKKVRNRS